MGSVAQRFLFHQMEDGATFSITSIFSILRAPQPAREALAHGPCPPGTEVELCSLDGEAASRVHSRAAHWILGPNRVLYQPEVVRNPEEIHAKLISLHLSLKNSANINVISEHFPLVLEFARFLCTTNSPSAHVRFYGSFQIRLLIMCKYCLETKVQMTLKQTKCLLCLSFTFPTGRPISGTFTI